MRLTTRLLAKARELQEFISKFLRPVTHFCRKCNTTMHHESRSSEQLLFALRIKVNVAEEKVGGVKNTRRGPNGGPKRGPNNDGQTN